MSKLDRVYSRQRRDRLRSAGLCIRCGQVPAMDGKKFCPVCRQHQINTTQARRDKLRESGLCISCGKRRPSDGLQRCTECLERQRRYYAKSVDGSNNLNSHNTKRRRKRLEQQKLCVACGKNAPVQGRKCCEFCLQRQQMYHARSQAKKGVEPKPIRAVQHYEHPPGAWYLTFDAGCETKRSFYQ